MKTRSIRRKIRRAIELEQSSMQFVEWIRGIIERNGEHAPQELLLRFRGRAFGYLEGIPNLIDEALRAAKNRDFEHQVRDVLEFSASYWRDDDDIVPDHLGLIGLIDDAYFTCRLLEELSARFEEELGAPLFEHDFDKGNGLARFLLSDEGIAKLEGLVRQTMNQRNNPLEELVGQLLGMGLTPKGFPLPMAIGSSPLDGPAYGTADFDAEVDAQLGAWGVPSRPAGSRF